MKNSSQEPIRLIVEPLEVPITVHLEPEGNAVEVDLGDCLAIAFPVPYHGEIQISHYPGGVLVSRTDGDYPTVTRKDGSPVPW